MTHPRFDNVLFQDVEESFVGIGVAQVKSLFSFMFEEKLYELAHIEEFVKAKRLDVSGLWRLKFATKHHRQETVWAGRVVVLKSLISAAHVVPRRKKGSRGAERWESFDNIESEFWLNHYINCVTWDLVEDTATYMEI